MKVFEQAKDSTDHTKHANQDNAVRNTHTHMHDTRTHKLAVNNNNYDTYLDRPFPCTSGTLSMRSLV